ncbi:MAG: CRP/FNR family transcriptional regulator [Lentisphaeria bacterium]|jgi:CRP/FNR family transcriptional regulator
MSYSLEAPATTDARCFQFRKVSCVDCQLNTICLPLSLHSDDIHQLNQIVKHRKPLQKGEFIFHFGDVFTSLYVIRSGSVKSVLAMDNGSSERVTGFYLPGDVTGMNGLANNVHSSSVLALDMTSVCFSANEPRNYTRTRISSFDSSKFYGITTSFFSIRYLWS